MADNRPRGRQRNISGSGKGVHTSGSGLSGGSGNRSGGGGGGKLGLIIAVLVVLLGGGGGIGALLGGGGSSGGESGGSTAASGGADLLSTALSSFGGMSSAQALGGGSADWIESANTGKLNTEVDPAARAKYTNIKGNGADTVTIMVYMCGTDLESKYGMATNDIKEMASATLSDKVNILVYTGGCRQWKTSAISNTTNQIHKIENGKLITLESSLGDKAMTDPAVLTSFIKYCSSNYPADRNMLIFWDHGGGSISGYGYDELHSGSGSMSLAGINTALKDAGIKYDFIGFDACLMATVETDLTIANYADYCIASEETEPGVGWYYTNWLTKLSADTSMPTIEIGKNIIDDFVDVCARSCQGQKTTLSIVDLAELSMTLGDDFKAFSKSTSKLIEDKKYEVVSDARTGSREFAKSSGIDQIDLVHFARNMGTAEGDALADTLKSAVKYNRTSSNMTNAYGVSVYFPYRKTSKVNTASNIYNEIGLDSEYSDCIREFAGVQATGQSAAGPSSPFSMLGGGGNSYSLDSLDSILSLVAGTGFSGRSLSDEDTAEYVFDHQLDAAQLTWEKEGKGYVLSLPEDQWSLVHSVDLNVFVDNGEGYVDMGLDNVFDFDDEGRLIPDTSGAWMSIDDQPVAYYHTDTLEDGDHYTISGYVPALLNGDRVHLIILLTDEHPEGYIAGADPDYEDGETETVARGLIELQDGDRIRFLCDFYSYDGDYQTSYYLGDEWVVNGEPVISDTYLDTDYIASYRFTDIYNNSYWTERIPE
ncbi:MAG: peptidase C11 [Lachnospiraceae bacterium]|nr:peptidase C11 [Lachnospiraceae bacterium]